MQRKENSHALLVGMWIGKPLGVYHKKEKTNEQIVHPYVCCSTIHNSQELESSEYTLTDEENVVFGRHKKEGTFAICYSMDDLEGIMLSEMSQKEKDQ